MEAKPDTARMLSALMKRIVPGGILTLTREEIEDAPEIEMKELFETDQVELKLKKV
jgi:hypothetical protein